MSVDIKIRDVTLRDGLQLTGKVLPTEFKVAFIRELIDLGFDEIEIGSMARPDLVPALANSLEVASALTERELDKCWIWTATPKHISRASEAGLRNFQYCFSATDSHNRANIGRTTEDSLAALPEAVSLSDKVGGNIQLTLATSFTCPFEGQTPAERVISIVADERTKGTSDVVICDTLGQATPSQVKTLLAEVEPHLDGRGLVFHGHDTWGLGVTNSLAAVEYGAHVVDGALGGLGGCPFAPGASGNTATEDLLFALQPEWLTTDKFRRIVGLGQKILEATGEPNRSGAAHAAALSGSGFPWSLAAGGIEKG